MHREERKGEVGSPRRRRLWLAVGIVALVAGMVCGVWLLGDRRSADERLAEIEAGRAVPDAENAALIYNELLEDPHVMSLPDSLPDAFWNGPLFYQRRDGPWRTSDCPELAAWIEGCTPIIDRLVEVSQLDTCRFRITIDIFDVIAMKRTGSMGLWTFLLTFAANNDLAESRPDATVTKWRCILQMGNHLRQQPSFPDHMVASLSTELTLRSMARFLAIAEPSARHLQEVEAMPLPLADDWQHHLQQIRLINDLTTRKSNESITLWRRLTSSLSPHRIKRVMNKVFGPDEESLPENIGRRYRQNIAAARGLRILVALRRYRDDAGHWPTSLAEISSPLSQTILTDPLNGGPFVYRQTEDAFELYSRGTNKNDETVRRRPDKGDDWPIWPPRGSASQGKQADANGV